MLRSDDGGAVRPPQTSGAGPPEKPRRRRWWRWLPLLLLLDILVDETFTFVEFEPPYCGHTYYETIEGETREAYRAYLKGVMDFSGKRYLEFEDGSLLRYEVEVFDDFGIYYDQMTRRAVDTISHDTKIDGVEYPAPPYLDEVRRELAEKYGPDHDYLRGDFIASSCEMMAAVVLTPESYARYRAEHGLPPLALLPPVLEHDPEGGARAAR